MKFPKSMHAEGWANHLEDPAAPKSALKQGSKAGAKPVSLHTPLHGGEPLPRTHAASTATVAAAAPSAYSHAAAAPAIRPSAGASNVSRPERRSDATPWIVGAGVGALLIGGALVAYRNMTPSEPVEPAVVSQATPSPEDALLQSAPPSAGPVEPAATSEPTPAPVEAPAVKAPEPVAEAPRVVAAAPAEPKVQAPAVVRAAPAPVAPVVKTLPPPAETLAQATPPAETLREPVQAPVAPAVTTPTPATVPPVATAPVAPMVVPPVAAAPVAPTVVPPVATAPVAPAVMPPVAQAEPQPPVVEDAGITAKVRMALSADSTLSAVPIAVSTDHGVVKLEGQAPDAPTRARATVVAASAAGVKAVDNRLTLPPATVVGQLSTVQ